MSEELDPRNYRAVLESLSNGVFVVDPECRIVFWNDGAERITGYLRHEVIGRSCHDNLQMSGDENNPNLSGCACPLLEAMHDGRPREANVFLRHKDGQSVPVRVRAVAIRGANDAIIGAAESFDERHPASDVQLHPNAQTVHKQVDDLTGISDHDSIRSYLQACLQDFAEDHMPFGVLSIAIDDLDQVRRVSGGQAANKILHVVATTLYKNLHEADFVGHWAQNRFVAIVVDCPAVALARVGDMLRRVVSVAAIPWWGDLLSVTISVGGSAAREDDSVDSLLARAEQALQSCLLKGGGGPEIT